MSWRNELTVGIMRAERLFYGTANGGLGSELSVTELGYLDGITPGTAAASKALILDSSADITSGINDFAVDNTLTVGEDDLVYGKLYIYGGPEAANQGGFIRLYTSDEHDADDEYFAVNVTSALMWIGAENDLDQFIIYGSAAANGAYAGTIRSTVAATFDDAVDIGGALEVTGNADVLGGTVQVGVDVTTDGELIAYGGSGSVGGSLKLYNSADGDTTITYYLFREDGLGDLQIGPDTDPDSLVYGADRDAWLFNGVAPQVELGTQDTVKGGLYINAADTLAGAEMRMYVPADVPAPEYYKFLVSDAGALTIGPDTDPDALTYDAGWLIPSGSSFDIVGTFNIGGVAVTATAAELNFLASATAGTQVASKAVIADANINIGVSKVTELHIGATGSETQVTATGAELNLNDNQAASVAFAPTGGAASGTVTTTFSDANGVQMATPSAFTFWFSSVSTGLDFLPITTSVVANKGAVDKEGAVAGADVFHGITDAAGEFDVTVTAAADDYYMVIQLPNGKLNIASVLTIT